MTINELTNAVLKGTMGGEPSDHYITGAAFIYQTTKFKGTKNKYFNYYLLARVGDYFGACCHTEDQADFQVARELSGTSIRDALCDEMLVVRIAALDAFFGNVKPHSQYCNHTVLIPSGDAVTRAVFRDELITKTAKVKTGEKVALIGVVNPLVKAIRDMGGVCLPCDLQMTHTQWGDAVERDMEVVMAKADKVICTAMTLSNGTFDRILDVTKSRGINLIVYGQTGSAIVAQYVGRGVSALIAEPFPFSQFTAEKSPVYVYQSENE